MNNFYTFIITSTLNTIHGVIKPEDRIAQTLESIESIRLKVPNSKIILADNSTVPLSPELKSLFESKVDILKIIDHNLFTLVANGRGEFKGPAEIYMMREVIDLIERENLIGRRIFKLSGRYRITDSFDIGEYENGDKINRYCFKINMWTVSDDNWQTRKNVIHFEGRLWSFCSSLFKDFQHVRLPAILECMLWTKLSMEEAFFCCIPHDKVRELQMAHVEGRTAPDNMYKFE